MRISKFLKTIIAFITLFIAILYIIACVAPYINTGKHWLLAFPGLAFPLLFFTLVFLIILLFLMHSKWRWISLIVMLAGFRQIITSFAFNVPKSFSMEKNPNILRVLQWNVEGWDESHKDNSDEPSYRTKMFELIQQQHADVLCFEEFFEPKDTISYKPNIVAIEKLGYPFHLYVKSGGDEEYYHSGIAIFSKYPFIDSGNYDFTDDNSGEHLLFADIKVNEKTFRIFATHLQSVHFEKDEYNSISKIKHAHESGLRDSKTIISKLKRGYESRYNQALLVHEKIAESPYQSLICGDFNDVPNSSTYFIIKGNFQDAFLKKGTFIGRTFRFISPTLRIDYILADERFKVTQYQRIQVPYSDHYPVEADLTY